MMLPSRLTVLSLCPLPEFVNDVFRRTAELTVVGEALAPHALRTRTAGHHVVLTSVNAPLSAAHIEALAPDVRAIATYSVGLDHLDLGAARARQIAVFNTPDVLTDSVAEVAMLHVLATLRRATESIALVRGLGWTGWTPGQLLGAEAAGKQLGILGMGRIGRGVARRAGAFGMHIHYHNRRRLDPALEDGATYHAGVDGLLSAVDVLVLTAPSGPDTRRILDRERLERLRPGAIVVNVARGDLIDDDALVAALQSGHVGAAGLDVFHGEPTVDLRYFEQPNVFMTPHIGSSTVEARRRMAEILLDGLSRWRRGETPDNRVV